MKMHHKSAVFIAVFIISFVLLMPFISAWSFQDFFSSLGKLLTGKVVSNNCIDIFGPTPNTKDYVNYSGTIYWDYCADSTHVNDYACDANDNKILNTYTCASGYTCSDGACKPAPTCAASNTCTDIVTLHSVSSNCTTSDTFCPYGCSNGACLSDTGTTKYSKRIRYNCNAPDTNNWCPSCEGWTYTVITAQSDNYAGCPSSCTNMQSFNYDDHTNWHICKYTKQICSGPSSPTWSSKSNVTYNGVIYVDKCEGGTNSSGGTTTKYYCYNNELKSQTGYCSWGCDDGFCHSSCRDDLGVTLSIKDYIYSYGSMYYDYCDSTNTSLLKEYICSSPDIKGTKDTYCQYGCSDGACIQVSTNQTPTCIKKENSCCLGENCTTARASCGEWYTPVFTGCDVNCNPIVMCEPQEIIRNKTNLTAPTCTDTDDGKNYYVKGTATERDAQGNINTITDQCTDLNLSLRESFCKGDTLAYEYYICPHGCSNGVCINQTFECESGRVDERRDVIQECHEECRKECGRFLWWKWRCEEICNPICASIPTTYYRICVNSAWGNWSTVKPECESGKTEERTEVNQVCHEECSKECRKRWFWTECEDICQPVCTGIPTNYYRICSDAKWGNWSTS